GGGVRAGPRSFHPALGNRQSGMGNRGNGESGTERPSPYEIGVGLRGADCLTDSPFPIADSQGQGGAVGLALGAVRYRHTQYADIPSQPHDAHSVEHVNSCLIGYGGNSDTVAVHFVPQHQRGQVKSALHRIESDACDTRAVSLRSFALGRAEGGLCRSTCTWRSRGRRSRSYVARGNHEHAPQYKTVSACSHGASPATAWRSHGRDQPQVSAAAGRGSLRLRLPASLRHGDNIAPSGTSRDLLSSVMAPEA